MMDIFELSVFFEFCEMLLMYDLVKLWLRFVINKNKLVMILQNQNKNQTYTLSPTYIYHFGINIFITILFLISLSIRIIFFDLLSYYSLNHKYEKNPLITKLIHNF